MAGPFFGSINFRLPTDTLELPDYLDAMGVSENAMNEPIPGVDYEAPDIPTNMLMGEDASEQWFNDYGKLNQFGLLAAAHRIDVLKPNMNDERSVKVAQMYHQMYNDLLNRGEQLKADKENRDKGIEMRSDANLSDIGESQGGTFSNDQLTGVYNLKPFRDELNRFVSGINAHIPKMAGALQTKEDMDAAILEVNDGIDQLVSNWIASGIPRDQALALGQTAKNQVLPAFEDKYKRGQLGISQANLNIRQSKEIREASRAKREEDEDLALVKKLIALNNTGDEWVSIPGMEELTGFDGHEKKRFAEQLFVGQELEDGSVIEEIIIENGKPYAVVKKFDSDEYELEDRGKMLPMDDMSILFAVLPPNIAQRISNRGMDAGLIRQDGRLNLDFNSGTGSKLSKSKMSEKIRQAQGLVPDPGAK